MNASNICRHKVMAESTRTANINLNFLGTNTFLFGITSVREYSALKMTYLMGIIHKTEPIWCMFPLLLHLVPFYANRVSSKWLKAVCSNHAFGVIDGLSKY